MPGCLLVELLDAFDLEARDEILRPLLDLDEDGDVADPAAVVVLESGGSP